MREDSFPNCPICKKDIVSDADRRGYCKLCGMVLDNEDEFCCQECRKKFMIIGRD